MYENGPMQAPMYGGLGGNTGIGQVAQGIHAKQSAASLLGQQIEEVSMQVAEILKMSVEIKDRLLGQAPEVDQTAGGQSVPTCGGVFGTASGRLYTIKAGLEESKRALARVLGEV